MTDTLKLAAQIGALLSQKRLMLATAESCTGGSLARTITEISGSSLWFDCGFITYSNASKIRLLNVPDALINMYGAVSAEVAEAMAAGAITNSGAQVSISTTGIAGPTGETPTKPVGTVHFGFVISSQTYTEHMLFTGDRHAIREKSVNYALNKLCSLLQEKII